MDDTGEVGDVGDAGNVGDAGSVGDAGTAVYAALRVALGYNDEKLADLVLKYSS
jgi:hypothetical protein